MIVEKELIVTAKTIDAAIEKGLGQLGLDRDSISVEVLATPTRGFLFGIGATDARVRLTYEVEEAAPAPVQAGTRGPDRPKPPTQPRPQTPPKPSPAQAKPSAQPRPQQEPRPQGQPKAQGDPKQSAQSNPQTQPRQQADPKAQGQTRREPERPVRQTRVDAVSAAAQGQRPVDPQPALEGGPPQSSPRDASDRPEEANRVFSPATGTSAERFLREVLDILQIEATLSAETDGDLLRIALTGNSMGLLIGRRGETLDALQYLTGLAAGKGEEGYTRVTLDIAGYRAKREEALVALAGKVAARVQKEHRTVTLEAMNPYERRIIHAALQGVAGVQTGSVGHEPNRRVVVSPLPGTDDGTVRKSRRRPRSRGARPAEGGEANRPRSAEADATPSEGSESPE